MDKEKITKQLSRMDLILFMTFGLNTNVRIIISSVNSDIKTKKINLPTFFYALLSNLRKDSSFSNFQFNNA